jgi:hypothetical protein
MTILEKRFCGMLSEKKSGLIYYIACAETKRLKIGFTRGAVEKRLRALQTGSAGQLVIAAVHPGDPDDERFLHHYFRSQRLHGEWFTMSEALFEHICMVTWMAARGHLLLGHPIEEWVRDGLRAMNEHIGLPEDLAALI